jgi:hypothetical protein
MILSVMLMLVLQLVPGPTFSYANGDPTFSRPDWVQQLLRCPALVRPEARRSAVEVESCLVESCLVESCLAKGCLVENHLVCHADGESCEITSLSRG